MCVVAFKIYRVIKPEPRDPAARDPDGPDCRLLEQGKALARELGGGLTSDPPALLVSAISELTS